MIVVKVIVIKVNVVFVLMLWVCVGTAYVFLDPNVPRYPISLSSILCVLSISFLNLREVHIDELSGACPQVAS